MLSFVQQVSENFKASIVASMEVQGRKGFIQKRFVVWFFLNGTKLNKIHRKPTKFCFVFFFLNKLCWWKQCELRLKGTETVQNEMELLSPQTSVGRKQTEKTTQLYFMGEKDTQNHIQGAILGPNNEIGKIYQHLPSWIQNICGPVTALYLPLPPI